MNLPQQSRYQQIATPVGLFQAVWTDAGLWAFEFHRCSEHSMKWSQKCDLPTVSEVLELAVADYFRTGQFRWNLELLDWSAVPEFHQRVLRACYEIPSGQTLTYGQLAERVGSPAAARAVGSAMARNRWPLLVPCHRVVGSTGKLTGYSGVGGLDTKRQLLDMELELSGESLFNCATK